MSANWILLHNHVSPETAYTVDNYPYSSYRTKCRWWLETATKGKGKGQMRCMQQTLNPKTGVWNKPQASQYNNFKVLYLDEKGHCHNWGVSNFSPMDIVQFVNTELYFQLNEEEHKRLFVIMVGAKVLNPNCWSRLVDSVTLARKNPDSTIEQLLSGVQTLRPDDHYLYEKDIAQILTLVNLEKQHNRMVPFDLKPQPRS